MAHIFDSVGWQGCVIGVNKWDLAGSLSRRDYGEQLQKKLAFAGFLPVVFFSALRDRSLDRVMDACGLVDRERRKTVSTGILNRLLQRAQEKVPARRRKHKKFRIYYATQVGTAPPVFRLFVNDPSLLSRNYELFLVNSLRRAFGFEGVPLRFEYRRKSPSKKK